MPAGRPNTEYSWILYLVIDPSTPFNLFFRNSNKLSIIKIFADYKTIPLKNSFAFSLNSSAFFSSSVISPLAAFSSAIFNHLYLAPGFSFLLCIGAREWGRGGEGREKYFRPLMYYKRSGHKCWLYNFQRDGRFLHWSNRPVVTKKETFWNTGNLRE